MNKKTLSKNHKKHQVKKVASELLNKLRNDINNDIDKKIDDLPKKDVCLDIDNHIISNEIKNKYLKNL
tara:strand:- start:9724 stop:9927 length:204 start_codon:yes stop_codon:yes gene_type:complete